MSLQDFHLQKYWHGHYKPMYCFAGTKAETIMSNSQELEGSSIRAIKSNDKV